MKKLITLILIIASFGAYSQVNYGNAVGAIQRKDSVGGKVFRFSSSDGNKTPLITPASLRDSLSNYEQIQDGLISGGSATIGTGSVTIDTANYRINKINHQSLPRTFTGISNSASGTQYYILVYGKTDNTLDTLRGIQDTIAVIPTKPNGTVSINTVLVGDGGVVSSSPDLSGYAKTGTPNNFSSGNNFVGNTFFDYGIFRTGFTVIGGGRELLLVKKIPGDTGITFQTVTVGGSFPTVLNIDNATQIVDFKQTPTVNGVPIGTGGVTSITPTFGLTPNTPITTSGTFGVDSAQIRTVANSYTLASGQPRLVSGTNIKTINSASLLGNSDIALEVPLTFGYGLTRSTNTITADTTSGTGLVSKTRLTGALGSYALKSYADAKVQNSLTASTTIAPSATAVNTGLATRENPLTFTLPLVRSTNTITVNAATTSTSGIVSISSQTFAGQKEFQDSTILNNMRFKALAGMGGGVMGIDNTGKPTVLVMADRTLSNKLSKTANYTVTLSDFGANGELILEVDCTGGAVTITLPSLANMTGVKLTVFKTDSSINAVTISGAVNINGSLTASLATQWSSTTITGGTSVYLAK